MTSARSNRVSAHRGLVGSIAILLALLSIVLTCSTRAAASTTPHAVVAAEGGLSGAGLLARQADTLVSGNLSAAGRALVKHGGRPGSAFPAATGSQAAISEQAGLIVRNILQNQTRRIEFLNPRLKMQVVDIYDGTGRGLRYSKDGDFIGFLEPPR